MAVIHVGANAADELFSETVMVSFWFPTSQCLATPQMYHLFPAVASVITSFPLVKVSLPAGAGIAHCWKPVPLTLTTVCAPDGKVKLYMWIHVVNFMHCGKY